MPSSSQDLTDIPVAYCANCDEKGPVVIQEFTHEEHGSILACYCPQCDEVINFNQEVSIEWYDAAELEKVTGWKVVQE
jgi:hypothetical protein